MEIEDLERFLTVIVIIYCVPSGHHAKLLYSVGMTTGVVIVTPLKNVGPRALRY